MKFLDPDRIEWDEYFSLCESGHDRRGNIYFNIAEKRLEVLNKIVNGFKEKKLTSTEKLREYLLSNQLASIEEMHVATGVSWERIKSIFHRFGDVFYLIRLEALMEPEVFYATIEPRTLDPEEQLERIQRWMSIRGVIDPYFFCDPMNMTESEVEKACRKMKYPSKLILLMGRDRRVYFSH